VVDRSQWLRGVTDLLLLSALEDGRSYGYELVERLSAAGIDDLSEATVYGTLRRLEAQKLVTSRLAASERGPARRYYEVTVSGRRWLRDAADRWTSFVDVVDAIVTPATTAARRTRGAM
jgi:PadR family transcriptional regulator PadR